VSSGPQNRTLKERLATMNPSHRGGVLGAVAMIWIAWWLLFGVLPEMPEGERGQVVSGSILTFLFALGFIYLFRRKMMRRYTISLSTHLWWHMLLGIPIVVLFVAHGGLAVGLSSGGFLVGLMGALLLSGVWLRLYSAWVPSRIAAAQKENLVELDALDGRIATLLEDCKERPFVHLKRIGAKTLLRRHDDDLFWFGLEEQGALLQPEQRGIYHQAIEMLRERAEVERRTVLQGEYDSLLIGLTRIHRATAAAVLFLTLWHAFAHLWDWGRYAH